MAGEWTSNPGTGRVSRLSAALPVPHCTFGSGSLLGRCRPTLTPVLKSLIEQSALPLKAVETDFAADASGFSTSVL